MKGERLKFDDMGAEGKHLKFVFFKMSSSGKTKLWRVINKYEDFTLGFIAWFSKFRKYSFYPNENTVYEKDCLRDIACFCEKKTSEHKINSSN